jgi:hypothetical protein
MADKVEKCIIPVERLNQLHHRFAKMKFDFNKQMQEAEAELFLLLEQMELQPKDAQV